MRITSQPATQLSTAPAKILANPTEPRGFSSALATASQGNEPQLTHNTSDHGNEKKNERNKTDDADRSVSAPQTPVTQLAGLVTPAATAPSTLGLPATVQASVLMASGQCSDPEKGGSSNLSGLQSVNTTAVTSASALFGAATTLMSAAAPHQLSSPEVLPTQGIKSSEEALTASSSLPDGSEDPVVRPVSGPGLPAAPEKPSLSPSTSNGVDSQSVEPTATALSPAISTDRPSVDVARMVIPLGNPTSAAMENTAAARVPQAQSTVDPTSSDAAPTLPPPGSDVSQNLITPNLPAKPQGAAASTKETNLKLGAASGKDHSPSTDIKGKRKADDAEVQLSTSTASDTPSDAKSADANSRLSQGESSPLAGQHLAGGEVILQQAIQVSVAVTSSTDHTASQSQVGNPASDASPAAIQSAATSNADATAPTAVNSAQLIQSIHQSDMRLGMHSPDFGAISISTSLTHQAISAQISTDHTELGRALAMHLPSIEEKLGNAYGIHAKVEVRDTSTASYGDASQQQSQSQQSKADRQRLGQGGGFVVNATPVLAAMTALSSSTASAISSDARLDIRI